MLGRENWQERAEDVSSDLGPRLRNLFRSIYPTLYFLVRHYRLVQIQTSHRCCSLDRVGGIYG